MTTNTNVSRANDTHLSDIDKALASARLRSVGGAPALTNAAVPAEAPKRKVLTNEERLERTRRLNEERDKRKAARDAEREAKKANATAQRPTPHMAKVEKAGAGLASLSESAKQVFDLATSSLSAPERALLAEHLIHHNRVMATLTATTASFEEGARVLIKTCQQTKFIGREGVVSQKNRIHCYVVVPGFAKPAYCFNSDVEPIAAPPAGAGAPEAPPAGADAAEDTEAPAESTPEPGDAGDELAEDEAVDVAA